ncbi:MAG: hypothetical protein MJZ26_12190 [Fibrobacter sp.]|nr:hypothetical protein [Fibrobacter sp.]
MAQGKFRPWLEPDGLLLLEGWARDGLTEEQIVHNMGITRSTFYAWKDKFSDISDALKKGREVVNYEVENALLKSALGYTKKITKPIKVKTERQVQGKGKIVEEHVEYVEEEIFIPPQVSAQIFWLKNRRPDKWRDKPDLAEVEEIEDDGLLEALDSKLEEIFSSGDDSYMISQEDL